MRAGVKGSRYYQADRHASSPGPRCRYYQADSHASRGQRFRYYQADRHVSRGQRCRYYQADRHVSRGQRISSWGDVIIFLTTPYTLSDRTTRRRGVLVDKVHRLAVHALVRAGRPDEIQVCVIVLHVVEDDLAGRHLLHQALHVLWVSKVSRASQRTAP